jgi:hypothetical protein
MSAFDPLRKSPSPFHYLKGGQMSNIVVARGGCHFAKIATEAKTDFSLRSK